MEVNKHCRELFKEKSNRVIISLSTSSSKLRFLKDLANQCMDMKIQEIDEVLAQASKQDIAVFNDMLPGLIANCKEEWRGDPKEVEHSSDKDIPCTLCGTPTRWVYLIKNKFTGQVINVGSTCIDQFTEIEFHQQKTKNQIKKEAIRQQRLLELVRKIPGIERRAKNYLKKLSNFSILIPNSIAKDYIEISKEFEAKFDEVLEKGRKYKIEDFLTFILLQNEELVKIEQYVNTSSNDAWVVTRQVVEWLEVNNKYDVLDELKETGYITHEIADKIMEKTFIHEFADELNFLIKESFGGELFEIDFENNLYNIKPFKGEDFFVSCPIRTAIECFGWKVFVLKNALNGEAKVRIDVKNIIMVSMINDENSRIYALNQLKNRLKGTDIFLKLYNGSSVDNYRQELEIKGYPKKSELITIVEYEPFLKEYKRACFFDVDYDLAEDIRFYIKGLGTKAKQYTAKELKDLRSVSKEFNL
ncbi:hypothetical protein M3626_06095 [Psychrobacillus sp. MER TA 17]|nr:hypothetical protein [Psychrobacillus sp. MER TA 17]